MIEFSGIIEFLLAFVSAILGLSVPVMLQVIERVDQRYGSTRLAERLKSERMIRVCIVSLIVAIFTCSYAVFCHFPSPCDNWLLNNSADIIALVSCVTLIISFLCSCRIVLIYYNPEKLQNRILKSYSKAKSAEDKERHFTDWVDLTKTLLQMADREPALKVYDTIGSEIYGALDKATEGAVEFRPYVVRGITSINENLCLAQRRPFSINNGNQILKDIISLPTKLSDDAYRLLWNNLQLQLYYGQEDWVYEYWSAAVQTYDLQLSELREGSPLFSEPNQVATAQDVQIRRLERQRFLEFHITLCADVLRNKRYDLLEKLLGYYRVMSPEYEYPLVPSSLMEVLDAFRMLDESPRLEFGIDRFYPMVGMKGIVDSAVLGSIRLYLSFLFVRIFSNIGRMENTHISYPTTSIGALKRMDESVEYIQRVLLSIQENKDLMGLLSFESVEDSKSKMWGILTSIREEIKIKQKEYKESLPNDPDLVAENLDEVKSIVTKMLSEYKHFGEKSQDGSENKAYYLSGISCFLYKNEAFQKDAGISYVGMADSVTGASIADIQNGVASAFYQKEQKRFKIKSEDVFLALDKLNIGNDYIVIAFDIYWDFYLYKKVPEFVKIDGQFYYKDIPIINLHGGPTDLVSQTLFVMKKSDMPSIEFQAPTDEHIRKYELLKLDDCFKLYGSIVKLINNEDLLENVQRMSKEEARQYSLFNVFINAKFAWESSVHVVSFKLMYSMRDNGSADSTNQIASFVEVFGVKGENLSEHHT